MVSEALLALVLALSAQHSSQSAGSPAGFQENCVARNLNPSFSYL